MHDNSLHSDLSPQPMGFVWGLADISTVRQIH